MPAKKTEKPPPKTRPQKQRFIEFAKSVGADDDKAMERAFGKAVPPKKPRT